MSFLDLFIIKTPQQREADSRRYDRWAFPFGEKQKDCIANLLQQLLPDENTRSAMAVYLIGREGYLGHYQADPKDLEDRSETQKIQEAYHKLKKQLPGPHRKKLSRYMSLILADAQVDDRLIYPSLDELQQTAAQLDVRLKQMK